MACQPRAHPPFAAPLPSHPPPLPTPSALSPPLVGPTPAPAEAVVSALLPLGRFLGSGGRGGPSPTAAAAVAVAAEARALVDALATARAGDDRVPAERWQAVFGELNRQLCW